MKRRDAGVVSDGYGRDDESRRCLLPEQIRHRAYAPFTIRVACEVPVPRLRRDQPRHEAHVRRQKRRHDETPRASTNPGPAAQHRGWQHEIGCDREHEDTAGLPDPVRLIERHGLEVDSRLEQHVAHEGIEEHA